VSVAGDCCTVIAVLAALQRFGIDATLLWLDAHGDFNTWETTRSGFIGGMPLAMIVGRGDQGLTRAVGMKPMAEENVVLADARDLDPAEAELLRASRVRRAYDLDTVLDLLPADRPLHVHLDVDVLDPGEAPAMLYPVAGGPTVAAARRLAGRLEGERNVASVSLTLWDLAADRDRRTERACLSVLDALVRE
jgi:arginase